jgi:hypothetical protein
MQTVAIVTSLSAQLMPLGYPSKPALKAQLPDSECRKDGPLNCVAFAAVGLFTGRTLTFHLNPYFVK